MNANVPGEPTFQALCKVQDMIADRDYRRAQKTVQQHLSAHPKAANILYKCINAMCLAKMGNVEEALEAADAVTTANPIISDVSALSALSVVYRQMHKIDRIAAMYLRAWEAIPDPNIGESYVLSLAVTGNFSEMQRTAAALFKKSQHPRHQQWAMAGLILQRSEPKLVDLGTRMLKKVVLDTKCAKFSVVQRHEVVLLYLHGHSGSYVDVAGELLNVEDAASSILPSLCLTPAWGIVHLLDKYLSGDGDGLELEASKVLAFSFAVHLLGNGTTAQEALAATCIDPRENWKYYAFYLKTLREGLPAATIPEKVLAVLKTRGIDIIEKTPSEDEARSFFMRVTPPESRTRDIALLDVSATKVQDMVQFLKRWGPRNSWVTYLDLKPYVKENPPFLSSRELEQFPAVHAQFRLLFDSITPGDAISSARDLAAIQPRTTHNNIAVAQLLLFAGYPSTVMAYLEHVQEGAEPCGSNAMLRSLVSGELSCFDVDVIVPTLALRNIQLDTMQYVMFEALMRGYHMSTLYSQSEQASAFFNTSLTNDYYDIVVSTFMHGTWNVLTHQLSPTMQKLRNSLHMCEATVYGIYAMIEESDSRDVAKTLENCSGELESLSAFITVLQEERYSINDDTSVLEEHVWRQSRLTPLLPKEERVQRVLSHALTLRRLLKKEVIQKADIFTLPRFRARIFQTVDDVSTFVFPLTTIVCTAVRLGLIDGATPLEISSEVTPSLHAALDYLQGLQKVPKTDTFATHWSSDPRRTEILPGFVPSPTKFLRTANSVLQGSVLRLQNKIKARVAELSTL